MQQDDEIIIIEEQPRSRWMNFWIFFCIIWSLLGLMAFATSAVCFFYNGKSEQKWLGLIISIIIGPFYWFYFATVDENYCAANLKSSLPPPPLQQQPPAISAGRKRTRSTKQASQ